MTKLNIATSQINTTPNDIAGNVGKIMTDWDKAEAAGADLVVTPEQSIPGYPLMDKAKNPDVLEAAQHGLAALIEKSKTMSSGIIVGLNEADDEGHVYNTAYLVHDGKIEGPVRKRHLPNYDVFDEKRIYTEGTSSTPIMFKGLSLGVLICEDIWHTDVAEDLRSQGADILISPNASPFYTNKHQDRLDDVLSQRAVETHLPIVYVNQVGGCDELVFDGHSTIMNGDGAIIAMAPGFTESLRMATFDAAQNRFTGNLYNNSPSQDPLMQDYKALVLGTRDYLGKIGMTDVVLGMSGGIDSAVVAAIAVDALGPDHVHLIKLPSQHSSSHSITDSDEAARLMGVTDIQEIPIKPVYDAFYKAVSPYFNSTALDVTEENLQARSRGTILMGLSNKNNWLVLSTGNKSEVSVGYCTLYGDMNGGFNPLKDVWKMEAYALARWRNKNHDPMFKGPDGPVMPDNIITKEPSAELAPGQLDTNSLPAYPVLDNILKRYVEQEQAIATIVQETNYDADMVAEIIRKVDMAEFKRQQACPGIKISPRNFGLGRRVPIVNPPISRMLANARKLTP